MKLYNLTELIKNSENRFISYKKLLENIHKDKLFPINDLWYKDEIRYFKNKEETWLKKLILEKEHENQQLNPPFCYER